MNADQFTKWLQKETEILFYHDSTPESFMNRVKPLIEELAKANKSDRYSENDLHKILSGNQPQSPAKAEHQNSYFDIVDLAMYRAN